MQHVSLPYATLGYHLMLHAPRSPNLSGSTQDIILLTWSNASASQVAKASLRVDAPAQLMVEQGQYTVCRRFVFQPTNCQRDDALYVRDWSMIVPYDYSLQGMGPAQAAGADISCSCTRGTLRYTVHVPQSACSAHPPGASF